MRSSKLGVIVVAAAFIVAGIVADSSIRARAEFGESAKPSPDRVRTIEDKLDDMKHVLVQLRADNEDLRARLKGLGQSMEHLASGKAVRPQRPSVEEIPAALPELLPLPE